MEELSLGINLLKLSSFLRKGLERLEELGLGFVLNQVLYLSVLTQQYETSWEPSNK